MRRWLMVLGLILVVAGVGGYLYVQSQGGWQALTGATAQATPTPLPPIETSPAVIVDAVVVPARFATLSFASSGIVAEVVVEEGERVEAGQLIASLENERQVIAIAQAEARVKSAQARIAELRAGARPEEIQAAQAAVDVARANLENLVDGVRAEDVAAAEAALAAAEAAYQNVLAGADDEQLIAAEAELANAEAALRQAQSAYDQVKWRNDVSALPEAANLEQATNNYEAARARYDLLAAGAEESDIAAARAEVERARAALEQARTPATASQIAAAEAQVRQAEAELALRMAGSRPETILAAEADLVEAQTILMQRQLELADTQLTAPFAGTIASLDLEVGEQVTAGAPVIQLADLSEWRIETDDLTEINVVYVREGDRVEIAIDALPELELTGSVVRIKPLGENKQGDITYTATIIPDTSDERLRWNMTASVTIQTDQSQTNQNGAHARAP
ncbi:MAG TPA: HlyD family efflux transporter periplasmic adaptor subunit [Caldilineaceae bacterium]|nr:HlyD family efflux transporter periplasmic adaptor subunit [Caldilineaceae bacterium]